MTEIEQLKKQLNDIQDKIKQMEKPKLKVGKWYKNLTWKGSMFYNTGDMNSLKTLYLGYGFSYNGIFHSLEQQKREEAGWSINDEYVLATDEEVKEALIKEAKKRGFKEGVKVKNGFTVEEGRVYNINANNFAYCSDRNSLTLGGIYIFQNGIWSEIIDEPLKVCGHEVKKVNEQYGELTMHYSIGCKKFYWSEIDWIRMCMERNNFKTVSFDNYSVSLEGINKILNL